MKRITVLLVLLLSICQGQAQNDKNLVFDANAVARTVSGFSAVEVSGAIDLYLSQGKEEAVAVSASNQEAVSRIKTEVRNGKLHIYFDGSGWNWKSWSNNNKMKAYVTFISLHKIEASGACNIKTADMISSDDLKIQLSGASDFTGEVKTGKLKLDASGASNFKVSGTSEKTEIDISGACDVKAYELKSDLVKVDASGASVVRIYINKELSAEASGGSNIYYKGNGTIRDVSTSGGATVKRKSED
ncbi:MAG: head GIN domain-containing protein [Bacteroidota bacterium]